MSSPMLHGVDDPSRRSGRDPAGGVPVWKLRTRDLVLDRPAVMGILNLTPDSFSDGGRLPDVAAQLERAHAFVEAGADLLDIGGESTRPGARPVAPAEELRRLAPLFERLTEIPAPVSIDTRRARVAEEALQAGAEVVNDVSGLAHDPEMAGRVAEWGAGLVLMHMRGDPPTMVEFAHYANVVEEVVEELGVALERARRAGIEESRVVLDPGIGFAKDAEQSYALLAQLARLGALGRPVLVGPSRKRFLAGEAGLPPDQRVEGTLAACVAAFERGARVFRVHDVRSARRALDVAHRIRRAGREDA